MTESRHRPPLSLKLAYSAFMAVLVPVYLHYYGPTNFFYFCDFALILTLLGIWIESPLLVSMCAVGITASQAVWIVDFLANLVGVSITGMTDYMFETQRTLLLRGLSLFHGWLPILLLYLVWALGYDRRALVAWTALAWVLILISFFVLPPPNLNPGLTPVNVNYVWGMSDHVPQAWVSPAVWLAGLMVGLPLVLFAPVHFVLVRVMPHPPRAGATAGETA